MRNINTNLHVYTLRLYLSEVSHWDCPVAYLLYPLVFAVKD